MLRRRLQLQGQVFARLTVLRQAPTPSWAPKRTWWHCRCECGQTLDVPGWNLKSGNTTSCGCWQREQAGRVNLTHGYARMKRQSREYIVWCHIIDRCENPNSPQFKDWGGRGIRMCEEWRQDFTAFLRDVGPRPSPQYRIERVDNDGHYEPGNVKWATSQEQNNNKRSNRRITWNEKTQTLAQWSRELGLPVKVLSDRLRRDWTIHRAFTTPLQSANIYHPRIPS